jgi:hypothetical protein
LRGSASAISTFKLAKGLWVPLFMSWLVSPFVGESLSNWSLAPGLGGRVLCTGGKLLERGVSGYWVAPLPSVFPWWSLLITLGDLGDLGGGSLGGGPCGERRDGKKRLRIFLGLFIGCSKSSSMLKVVPFPTSLVTWICPFKLRTYWPIAVMSILNRPSVSSKRGVVSVAGTGKLLSYWGCSNSRAVFYWRGE